MLTEEQFTTAHRFETYQAYLDFLQITEDPGYPIAIVGRIMGLPAGWHTTKTRRWEFTAARHLSAWIAVEYLGHKTQEAAKMVGSPNHCMAIYAKRRAYRALLGYDYKLKPFAEKIKEFYDRQFKHRPDDQPAGTI